MVDLPALAPTPSSRLASKKRQLRTTDQVNSLLHLCRRTIDQNLERYPPDALGQCLDDEEWGAILESRWERTKPLNKTGEGLDGTGRQTPAIAASFMLQLPLHLQMHETAHRLVWKDCVESRFPRSGTSRPKELLLPWPNLIKDVQTVGEQLSRYTGEALLGDYIGSIGLWSLETTPMSVRLLQETGVGKILRKHIKRLKEGDADRRRLELPRATQLLKKWMQLAADSGVEMTSRATTLPRTTSLGDKEGSEEDDEKKKQQTSVALLDHVARHVQTWRDLYTYLQERAEERRNAQGQRMREIRRNLNDIRPKVVAVRVKPTARQERVLGHPMEVRKPSVSSASHTANRKLSKLRQQAHVQSARRPSAKALAPKKVAASFGTAVALAAGKPSVQASSKRTVKLGGGKLLHMPKANTPGARGGANVFRGRK